MKQNLKIGDKLQIHCYKHNGKLHQVCDEAIILDIDEEKIVVANDHAKLTEADGRTYRAKEPAILIFYNKNWFNVIGQLKEFGLFYYCNIATPYIIDNDIIKYIDYDLDLRVFPDGSFKVLDRGEYRYHKEIMHYSEQIDHILKSELTDLIELVRKKVIPFDKKTIEYYYNIYNKVKGEITS